MAETDGGYERLQNYIIPDEGRWHAGLGECGTFVLGVHADNLIHFSLWKIVRPYTLNCTGE